MGEGCDFVDSVCWFVGVLPTCVAATLTDTGPLAASRALPSAFRSPTALSQRCFTA